VTTQVDSVWSAPLASTHPVVRGAAALDGVLDGLDGVEVTGLSGAEKRSVLLELTRTAARVEALRLRVLSAGQAAGDVADQDGSRDAVSWLAHHARLDPGRARHLGHLARALGRRRLLAAGLASGGVDLAQAAVIAQALDALPDTLDPATVRLAEERLVAEAAVFDPRRLRVLGRRILQVVAPEVAEDHERRLLDADERHAAAASFLRVRRRGDGTSDLHARLADTVADRLLSYLHAHTNPRRTHDHASASATPGDRSSHDHRPHDGRPHDRRMADAFAAFLEAADPTRLPLHGGDATTVVVTTTLDALVADLHQQTGTAHIGDVPITAAQARRLACTARILPAVLGGASEVLDLGRTRRLFSPAQRRALALAHPTCQATGCGIPAPWCEAHHAGDPWSRGGRTDLCDGVLLCSHHHHLAHDTRHRTERHADGSVRFHRRT